MRWGDARPLEKVFQVNIEIGRAVREYPSMRRALLGLQSNVNAITVSLKAGDSTRALDALEASLRLFREMSENRSSPKKNL